MLGLELTGQVDSGDPVTKVADNVAQLMSKVTVFGDGTPRILVRDMELEWLHRILFGCGPDVLETPDAASQADKAVHFRSILPMGVVALGRAPDYKTVSLQIDWGAIADLDSGAAFNVDSASLSVQAYLGKTQQQWFTRRIDPTAVDGSWQKFIPNGRVRAIILQTTDRSDSIDVIKLKHQGKSIYNFDFEASRLEAARRFGIDFVDASDPDAEREPGITILDGQNLVSHANNMELYLETTASKNLHVLYLMTY